MKYLILGMIFVSGCERYIDNDEFLPPIDKPIEVQVREMFEFLEKPLIDMTTKKKRKAVTDALNYMIAEGMVVKTKQGYRLKTEEELEREMGVLLNEE